MIRQIIIDLECAVCGKELEMEELEVYNLIKVSPCKCMVPVNNLVVRCSECDSEPEYSITEEGEIVMGLCDCQVDKVREVLMEFDEMKSDIVTATDRVIKFKKSKPTRFIRDEI